VEAAVLVEAHHKPVFLVLEPNYLEVLTLLIFFAEDLGLQGGAEGVAGVLLDFDEPQESAVDRHDVVVLLLEDGDDEQAVRFVVLFVLGGGGDVGEPHQMVLFEEWVDVEAVEFDVVD
jgi:hypothetical protein